MLQDLIQPFVSPRRFIRTTTYEVDALGLEVRFRCRPVDESRFSSDHHVFQIKLVTADGTLRSLATRDTSEASCSALKVTFAIVPTHPGFLGFGLPRCLSTRHRPPGTMHRGE